MRREGFSWSLNGACILGVLKAKLFLENVIPVAADPTLAATNKKEADKSVIESARIPLRGNEE